MSAAGAELGTRIRTLISEQLGVDPKEFAERLLRVAEIEHDSILSARAKVRAKGESGAE